MPAGIFLALMNYCLISHRYDSCDLSALVSGPNLDGDPPSGRELGGRNARRENRHFSHIIRGGWW